MNLEISIRKWCSSVPVPFETSSAVRLANAARCSEKKQLSILGYDWDTMGVFHVMYWLYMVIMVTQWID